MKQNKNTGFNMVCVSKKKSGLCCCRNGDQRIGEIMKLRNVLIVVNDMERAIRFYKEIFGMQVILDQDGNVILSEGLVLQDAKIWKSFIDKDVIHKNNATELYFEESNIEGFVKRLEDSDFEIEFVNKLMTHSWNQTVVRFYDPDGNLIEVGTPI